MPCLPPLPERTLEPRLALLSRTCAGASIEFAKPCRLKLGPGTAIVTFVCTLELRFPWQNGADFEAKTAVMTLLRAMQKPSNAEGSAACSPDATVNTSEDNEDTRADFAVKRLADTVMNADSHRTAKAAMMLAASPMVLVLIPSATGDKPPVLQDWKLVAVPIEYLRPVDDLHRKESVQVEMNAYSYLRQLATRLDMKQANMVKPLHVLQSFDVFMPHAGSW